jgi:hypothetical protein
MPHAFRIWRSAAALALCALVVVPACKKKSTGETGGSQQSSTPTTPTPSPAPGGGTTATFTVDLPVAAADSGSNAYGIWPFGVHGASHAADGHPGFDVEFTPGATVHAAAEGTLLHATADGQSPGRFTIRINHTVGSSTYATDYTNVTDLAAGVTAGAAITRGQALGKAGVQSQFIGTSQVTWGMTHFQVNDFSKNEGLTNPNAVSPELHLSAGAKALFDTIWRATAYQTEWCEPFPTNSRAAVFPMSRTWTKQSGSLPDRLEVRCVSENSQTWEYTLKNADGSAVEAGTLSVSATTKPLPTVDVQAAGGGTRLGLYDIVSGTLQINLGTSRPSSLSGATTYTTSP